ncbi:MAG: DNA adenine methylase, partial [Myxococcaceae bacterium]
MGDALSKALARARHVLESLQGESVEKTIWGSPAGKKRLAKRLVAMLPAHKTYVEPFAGSAAVLFEKAPSDVEAINDADPEIADAYRLIQKLTPAG